ncbi:hypothetical protein V6N12_009034 [Hibiscus sabdariffa]|uniref:P-type H(+)-exporting transporter n=1 Tax=Hibiscus sabdariffa TaxID=183260 RepID=A0ABR2C4H1_9ROSI
MREALGLAPKRSSQPQGNRLDKHELSKLVKRGSTAEDLGAGHAEATRVDGLGFSRVTAEQKAITSILQHASLLVSNSCETVVKVFVDMSDSKTSQGGGAGKTQTRNLPSWMSSRENESKSRGNKPNNAKGHDSSSNNTNFPKLMEGVVFVLSGFVNPERSTLRSQALAMGAEYQPDWNSNCTLLVCAFQNTPKFRQVEADCGTIVSKEWILECHAQKKLVDIDPYLMHAGKPWRRSSLSNETSEEKQGSSLAKSYTKVETQSQTTSGPSESKASQLAQERLSPSKVKKWVVNDFKGTISWLESQEEKPEPQEIKQIAGEGILTCLQDAIDCLAQKQDVQQITEQWSFIPRVVKEIAVFDGNNRGCLPKEDLLKKAKVCKQIYEEELSLMDNGSSKRKEPKTDGGEEGNKKGTKAKPGDASCYDSDETIEMTEEEIDLAYKNFASGTFYILSGELITTRDTDMEGKSISLEEIKNETVDLERIPVEEVFQQLKCTREGLSSEEGKQVFEVLGIYVESSFMGHGGKPPDWQDFIGIVSLLFINSTISFIEENNAGNAAAALMAGLAPKTKVLRDGKWGEQDASILVPGDIISIKLGDIVPADARLLEGDALKIDQSALTGESLPVNKNAGDEVFSGSTVKQGEIEAIVIATGVHTFFGKAAHLVDSTNNVGHFQQVLTAIGNFCICSIAIGMLMEIVVMYPIQHRAYRDGIDNLLVLLIGGIPIAMPTVLSVTMAIGSHRLSQQGAITKRMTAIEEMAGMDVLCGDKIGTLTLNKLTVDKSMVEVFMDDVDKEMVLLLAARASRIENQDAIDTCIVGMLSDPKEARAGITEVHFFPFNPVDKRTAMTYIASDGSWHRVSKGAPEQIIELCNLREDAKKRAHDIIAKFADRGLRSLAVAKQNVPEKTKDGQGDPWRFVGLLPLFDPPRHDSAETIRRALDLGVNVKMITGDQLAIGKETGRRLGMGTNMYPSSALLGDKGNALETIGVDELIEKADGFAGVFPEHKYEIVKRLQQRKHICGMTGDGVNDAPALKKADIGIAVDDATDAARSASDIVLTEPGLSVIVSAVLTSRAIFQRMKNYTIYAVSITIRIVLGFMLLALIWKFDFSPFMVLIIAILNDGTIMTISKDRVKPSPVPDSWKLKEIFGTGIVLGTYLACMTVVFFWAANDSDFFSDKFEVRSIRHNQDELTAAVYLQVSIVSQALIFVTRSRSWSFVERPGFLLVIAFLLAQLVATVIAVYADWGFARIKGIGWGWAGVIWLYSLVTYFPLDVIKFLIRYSMTGKAWENLIQNKTAFTTKKDYGRGEREAQWALAQRTLHGLTPPEFAEKSNYKELSDLADQARKRAEVARLRELHTLKGHVESVVKLKGLDIDTIQQHYTV